MYIKPALRAAAELQRIHAEKIQHVPSPDDISKMMETMASIVVTSVKESVSPLAVMDRRILEMQTAIQGMSQDLQTHIEDEGNNHNEIVDALVDDMSTSKSIEALVEHLAIELAKNENIPPMDAHQLSELKNRVADTKINLNLLMAMINRHNSVPHKQTKLNRVLNQTRP
jgi:Na+/phosphate symporter